MKAKPKYDSARGWKTIITDTKKRRYSFVRMITERFLYTAGVWQQKETENLEKHLSAVTIKWRLFSVRSGTLLSPHIMTFLWHGKGTHTESAECQNWDVCCGPESRSWPFHERGCNLSENYSQHTDTRPLGPKRTSGWPAVASCKTDAVGFYATLIKLKRLIRQRKDILLCPENTKKSRTHHFLQQCQRSVFLATETFCFIYSLSSLDFSRLLLHFLQEANESCGLQSFLRGGGGIVTPAIKLPNFLFDRN